LARKHCGRQNDWSVSIDTLLKKSGSGSPRRVFRKMIRDMITANHLPDYAMEEIEGDKIRFILRDALVDLPTPVPSEGAIEKARALAPGADVYGLVADWQAFWAASGRQKLRSVDGAFLGFVTAGQGRG